MSGTEQVFFLVVVPAAIVGVIWLLASIGGPRSQHRYRPGRPYSFTTVWYVANHGEKPAADGQRAQLPAGAGAAAREGAQGSTGGASDRW